MGTGVIFLGIIIWIIVVSFFQGSDKNTYHGGADPYGGWCDFGYNPIEKTCCDDDDYSCEARDTAPKGATAICLDGTYDFSITAEGRCIGHDGVDIDLSLIPKKRSS